MYWKVIDNNRYEMLEKIIENISLKNYYMAGGTALALQTGVRESYDFVFFVQEEFDENLLIHELNQLGNLEVTICRKGTVHAILENVQVTFLHFPNELIAPTIETQEITGLHLANIQDIALMKLIAISQRGTKKDFFDLYYICNNFNITIRDILNMLSKKYDSNKINYAHILQSLSYFEDAEDENLPKVFLEYDWNEIKQYYMNEQKKIYAEAD